MTLTVSQTFFIVLGVAAFNLEVFRLMDYIDKITSSPRRRKR